MNADYYFASNVLQILALTTITLVFGRPIVGMIVRRFERREVAHVQPETLARIEERLDHLSNGMEAMAVEVERISEGQRFASRLLAGKKPEQLRVLTPH
jgi:hypothetical protein